MTKIRLIVLFMHCSFLLLNIDSDSYVQNPVISSTSQNGYVLLHSILT